MLPQSVPAQNKPSSTSNSPQTAQTSAQTTKKEESAHKDTQTQPKTHSHGVSKTKGNEEAKKIVEEYESKKKATGSTKGDGVSLKSSTVS